MCCEIFPMWILKMESMVFSPARCPEWRTPSVAFLSLSAVRVKVLGYGEAETATGTVIRSASLTQSAKSVSKPVRSLFLSL